MQLVIDETTCKKDGICIASCPNKIIRFSDENGFPEIIPGLEVLCISCGHCVAVCPDGAITHPNVPLEHCTPIKKELVINVSQAEQFLRSRRSIRVYKDLPVEGELIEKLITIASYAPTGGNFQLVRWIVVEGAEKVKRLSELTIEWMQGKLTEQPYRFMYPPEFLKLVISGWEGGEDPILRKAPALIVATAPEFMATDPTLALGYFELAAVSMGMGTCWAGLLKAALLESEPARAAIGLKSDGSFFYPMMLGYPKFQYRLMPGRKAPKIIWV